VLARPRADFAFRSERAHPEVRPAVWRWFAAMIGEEWWPDGEGIYRRKPETHLSNIASPSWF
jgi:hypothetical protein